jgi:hypothetical protein
LGRGSNARMLQEFCKLKARYRPKAVVQVLFESG